jgi:hypothetical protein
VASEASEDLVRRRARQLAAEAAAGGDPADGHTRGCAGGGQAQHGTGDAGGLPLGDVVLGGLRRHQSAPAEPT